MRTSDGERCNNRQQQRAFHLLEQHRMFHVGSSSNNVGRKTHTSISFESESCVRGTILIGKLRRKFHCFRTLPLIAYFSASLESNNSDCRGRATQSVGFRSAPRERTPVSPSQALRKNSGVPRIE